MRGRRTAALVMVSVGLALLAAAPGAGAARLAGGRAQAAIQRAFSGARAHRGQAIVSIRTSTVSPGWALVRSVTAQRAGRTGTGSGSLTLHSAFYRLAGARAIAARPPARARADLTRALRIAVVYSGSGAETVDYDQPYRSDCQGAGNLVDTQTDSVSPMSWSVRYIVDLDDVLAATRGPDGTVVVPNIAFQAAGSRLDAVEKLSRTVQDTGCNGNAVKFACTATFHAGGSDPGAQLSLIAGTGLEVGVPMKPSDAGNCAPDVYTLGPSLWDAGAATAVTAKLGLGGGRLPANPYAPVAVAWPGAAAAQSLGFASSPCQGEPALTCSDSFHWKGTVRLENVP